MDLIIYSANKIDKSMSSLQSPEKKTLILQTPRTGRSHNKHETSLPSINPEGQTKNFKDRTLEKLVEINKEYLKNKVKVGDVRKPSRYAYRMPSKTGTSEYNRIFARSMPANDLTECIPNRSKIANNLKLPNNGITNYQSTYSIQFTRQKQEQLLRKMQARKPDRYERKQGPFFTETSYHRDYSSHAQSPRTSEVKPEDHIAVGGKFNEDTTYKQHYRSKDGLSPPKPIMHKDHSIFVKIGKPKQSNYQQSYLISKPQKMQESCKPVHKLGNIVNKIKYRTEYSDKYVQQAPNEKKDFECLNSEQLKNYVLSILKH